MDLRIKQTKKLQGTLTVPGDKSISHRAIMLGAIATGTTEVTGFLMGQDCLSTVDCFRKLGINIAIDNSRVKIEGKGLDGLKEPVDILDVGNSGTTIRLISGILAGQDFTSFLTGDQSIRKRPMARITKPLTEMGAEIIGRQNGNLAPLAIKGGNLKKIKYTTPVASAQVKSSILLAGLYAEGWTEITEPIKSRNHTELMLKSFGAQVEEDDITNTVRVKGRPELVGGEIKVPGDISSAAFFLTAGAIIPEGSLTITNVGLNPTRTGIIDVLEEMGAQIKVFNKQKTTGEVIGDIKIESSSLKGIKIGGEMIPRLIDEIPILAVAASCASGVTEIRNAEELKVKESNRLAAIARELNKLGAKIEELPDGLKIYGGQTLKGTICDSYDDHRIAMALAIAGLVAQGETIIKNSDIIDVSFPNFTKTLQKLTNTNSLITNFLNQELDLVFLW
ncbi:MAG: 3-phosphoshikimate 1-carboxyvinyltransferase [Clostridia bacterium]|jgi:3-phosphoshikimate 1-carboxyvinyltransferase|nr:3-phosphoshikimate 1-carboxyvinyltransferase [Clostridia bacterium]MDN5321846.1 3-phosphoshikimate 1-carboxyvinyltransferase [Clostridia bacterium]